MDQIINYYIIIVLKRGVLTTLQVWRSNGSDEVTVHQ